MTPLLIDEAWSRADPAKLRAAGYVGVMLYISRDASKCPSIADIAAIHAQDMGVGFVFEDGATRALGGAAAGTADGIFATAWANAHGVPTTTAIYAAVDFGASPSQLPTVLAYLGAFAKAVAPRSGRGYGDAALMQSGYVAGMAPGWQTSAWSGSTVSSHAVLYQRTSHTLPNVPGSYDEDVELGDAGLWLPTAAPAPTPPPVASKGSDDMARLFACTTPLADPREGTYSGSVGPRWIHTLTELALLKAHGQLENPDAPDLLTEAQMTDLLGPLS